MWYKRYQYWSREGKVVWTDWFPFIGEREPWQIKGKLKNEYRYEESNN